MTGYELQYISTTDGAFDSTLAANITATSVVESKFLITSFYYGRPVYFGVSFADTWVRASEKDMQMYTLTDVNVSSYLTLNEEHTAYFSPTEYRWNGTKIADVTGTVAIPSSPRFRSQIRGNLYYFKITDNNVDIVNLVAWQDGNGNLGMYDKVNDVFYTPSSGTWTAGPRAHVFQPSKISTNFFASGGTFSLDVEAETTWTASTPSFVSLSPSTGDSGTTTVTVTCPSYTGATKREETITFTDNDNYTFDFKVRQRGNTAGFSNIYLGENQLMSSIYIGENMVNTIYLGENEVYSSGPFVGLKVKPSSLSFNNYRLSNEITIQSSENWTITDDSNGWLSYSTTTGNTGKTVVTVTASTTQSDRTANITVSSVTYSAITAVEQLFVVNKKLTVQGSANIAVDFNPYEFYAANNNYVKFELCHNFIQGGTQRNYLFAPEEGGFTFERYYSGTYFNLGSTATTADNALSSTNGVEEPIVLVINGTTATCTKGSYSCVLNDFGTLPDSDNLYFYKTITSDNYNGEFYGMKIYGENDVLMHWFMGYDDGVNVGIEDLVTGNKFQPNGSNYTIQCSDLQ